MSKDQNRKQDIAAILLGVSVALILWVTVLSRDVQTESTILFHPLHSLSKIGRELLRNGIRSNSLGNIVLFLPFGILLPIATGQKRAYGTVLAAFCFSFLIEAMQMITGRGFPDVDDLIFNTTGALVGFGLLRAVCAAVRGQKQRNAEEPTSPVHTGGTGDDQDEVSKMER